MNLEEYMTNKEAAADLGISRQRVSKLCQDGILTTTKWSRTYLVERASVSAYKVNEERKKYTPTIGKNRPSYLKKAQKSKKSH